LHRRLKTHFTEDMQKLDKRIAELEAKHLPAYLDELSFRFNRRKRADLFLDTLR
jgi:hypothetical protein